MKIDHGTIAFEKDETNRSSCFPGVCALPSGRWLACFQAGPTKNLILEHRFPSAPYACVTYSDDHGRTWAKPFAPFAPAEVDGRIGRFRIAYPMSLGGNRVVATLFWVDYSRPDLPVFNSETSGLKDIQVFLARSENGGETWSKPEHIDKSPFDEPCNPTGPILVLPDGQWACHFETGKSYNDPDIWACKAIFKFSTDQGRTWPRHTVSAQDTERRLYYWDHRPGVLFDGRILDTYWTYDRITQKYLDLHLRESRNAGHTWSELWASGLPTGQPAPPVQMPDGSVGLVYVDRVAAPAIKVRFSRDNGRTWPAETEAVLYQHARPQTCNRAGMTDTWNEMAAFSVGLPQTTLTLKGELLAVYYAGPDMEHTDIRWARIQP